VSERDDEAMSAETADMLAALGEALGPDVVPPGLEERAEALFGVRDLDSDLAGLLDDAAAEPAGMRGGTAGSRLRFAVAGGAVVIEVDQPAAGVVTGRFLEGEIDLLALERPTGTATTVAVDELGGFAFASTERGPARLRLTRSGGAPVRTDWFLI
jgi:hypothetical protein